MTDEEIEIKAKAWDGVLALFNGMNGDQYDPDTLALETSDGACEFDVRADGERFAEWERVAPKACSPLASDAEKAEGWDAFKNLFERVDVYVLNDYTQGGRPLMYLELESPFYGGGKFKIVADRLRTADKPKVGAMGAIQKALDYGEENE